MDKILDGSKLKALSGNKIKLMQLRNSKFVFGWPENTLGKGDKSGYQHFLHFPKQFQKPSPLRVVNTWNCLLKSLLVVCQSFQFESIRTFVILRIIYPLPHMPVLGSSSSAANKDMIS